MSCGSQCQSLLTWVLLPITSQVAGRCFHCFRSSREQRRPALSYLGIWGGRPQKGGPLPQLRENTGVWRLHQQPFHCLCECTSHTAILSPRQGLLAQFEISSRSPAHIGSSIPTRSTWISALYLNLHFCKLEPRSQPTWSWDPAEPAEPGSRQRSEV